MAKRFDPPSPPPGDFIEYVYRPWITLRDGRRIYAKDFGLKAFRFPRRH